MTLLRVGQELGVRYRTAEGLVQQSIRRLKLDPTVPGGWEAKCWASFVDATGVSLYIVRPFPLGGDIKAFVPAAIRWPAYFEPLQGFDPDFIRTSHYSQVFPRDFF